MSKRQEGEPFARITSLEAQDIIEQDPNSERLENTVETLAKIHQSNAQIQLKVGQSRNILERIEQGY